MMSPFSFFGLSRNPFSKGGTPVKDCFHSHDFDEMYGALESVKDSRGVAVFTSTPGNGKTFVLHAFAEQLNPNLYHMSYICLSTVSIAEFYKQLCNILGVPPKCVHPRCGRRAGLSG